MTGRILLRLSPIAAVLALAACGGGGETTVTVTTTTSTTTTPAETTSLRVYVLKDGKVQPVAREVPKAVDVAGLSLKLLLDVPTSDEKRLGLSSAVPELGDFSVLLSNGLLQFDAPTQLSRAALAQVVYTLTQFPTVKAVEIKGKRYTRADFENETPIILVESPLPFQHVSSPLRVAGTANTFEATFNYDLVDADGKVIATHFVTATSGTGTRGTFDFTVPYTIDKPGLGNLKVYELSAADGSRIHQSEIPIFLEQ